MVPNNTNLRVVLVGVYTQNFTRIKGGVQAATTYLLQGLSKINDLELHILTLRPSDWTGPDSYIQNGMRVHLIPPYPRLERLRGYRIYQSFVNRLLSQIQPVVIHAQEASADALVSIRSGYPTVITVHGIKAEDAKYVRSLPRRLRFYFDSMLTERKVIRSARYLIAISHYVTNYFNPLLRNDIRLEYIPNAVDESFFSLGGNFQKQVVLFAGRVISHKRVHDLLQAFSQVSRLVPQAELRIAGEFYSEPAYVETLRGYIHKEGLSEKVYLLGELSQEDLLREYRDCMLVALSSAQENTPMVIAQAMAAGKPIVATKVGGLLEMVGQKGERGLLTGVGDINGMASSIIYLFQNPDQREILGQAGHAFALQNYHPNRVSQNTYDFYREIATLENKHYG